MTKPSPISLVVCDNVYRELGGKSALVGLFNRITSSRFPAKHSRLRHGPARGSSGRPAKRRIQFSSSSGLSFMGEPGVRTRESLTTKGGRVPELAKGDGL